MRRALLGAAVLAVGGTVGCGSSIMSPPKSLLDPDQVRDTVPAVSVTPKGVSPQTLHLDAPVTVTFTNDDRAAHRLLPAPELGFGDCPEMLQLGTLEPAQKGTARSCSGRAGSSAPTTIPRDPRTWPSRAFSSFISHEGATPRLARSRRLARRFSRPGL